MSDDLIRRSDAINLLWYFQDECCSAVVEDFEELPSADRPQGEWERIPYSFAGGYRCSICGQKSLENHWNYCPQCGAMMKGEADGTD